MNKLIFRSELKEGSEKGRDSGECCKRSAIRREEQDVMRKRHAQIHSHPTFGFLPPSKIAKNINKLKKKQAWRFYKKSPLKLFIPNKLKIIQPL
jgi:hypothetical protein